MLRIETHPLGINLLVRQRLLHKASEGIVAHPADKCAPPAQTGDAHRDVGRCPARTLQQFTLAVRQKIHYRIAKYPDCIHITFLAKFC